MSADGIQPLFTRLSLSLSLLGEAFFMRFFFFFFFFETRCKSLLLCDFFDIFKKSRKIGHYPFCSFELFRIIALSPILNNSTCHFARLPHSIYTHILNVYFNLSIILKDFPWRVAMQQDIFSAKFQALRHCRKLRSFLSRRVRYKHTESS